MDLNDLWQNHKRFILGIAGGTLVFLIGMVVISSKWDVGATTRGVSSAANRIKKIDAPTTSDLAGIVGDCDKLSQRLGGLFQQMEFTTRNEFVVPGNESPDLFYNRRRDEEQEKLVQEARRLNIRVNPSLGLPEVTPSGSEAIQRYLRALDLVDQVVTAAIASRVRAVDEIEVRDAKSGTRAKGNSFLDTLAVKFTMTGSTGAIASLLDALTKTGTRYVAIEDAEIETDPRRLNTTVLHLTVAALGIHPEIQVTETRK